MFMVREEIEVGAIVGEETSRYEKTMKRYSKWVHKPIAKHIAKQLENDSSIIADLGSGPGFLAIEIAKELPDSKIIGVDLSEDMLKISARRAEMAKVPNVEFKFSDIENLQFEDNELDLVVSNASLHHWENPEKAFREIYRVLRTGGVAYICDLRRDSLVGRFSVYLLRLFGSRADDSLKSSYTIKEVEDLVEGVGFSSVDVYKFLNGGWGLIAKLTK